MAVPVMLETFVGIACHVAVVAFVAVRTIPVVGAVEAYVDTLPVPEPSHNPLAIMLFELSVRVFEKSESVVDLAIMVSLKALGSVNVMLEPGAGALIVVVCVVPRTI